MINNELIVITTVFEVEEVAKKLFKEICKTCYRRYRKVSWQNNGFASNWWNSV